MSDPSAKAMHLARTSVRSVLCLGHDPAPDAKLSKLGADSLDMVEIAMDAEDRSGGTINDQDLTKDTTISDLAKLIDATLATAEA
jgi:acyl carrier protein